MVKIDKINDVFTIENDTGLTALEEWKTELESTVDTLVQMMLEQKVKIKVEHPGVLEVPEGKKVNELPLSHFKKLIKKKGWEEVSKALINLKVWNKNDDPELSKWADKTQEELADWVEKQREGGEKI